MGIEHTRVFGSTTRSSSSSIINRAWREFWACCPAHLNYIAMPPYEVWPARMLDCFNTRVRASVKARARRAAQAQTPMLSHNCHKSNLLRYIQRLLRDLGTPCMHVWLCIYRESQKLVIYIWFTLLSSSRILEGRIISFLWPSISFDCASAKIEPKASKRAKKAASASTLKCSICSISSEAKLSFSFYFDSSGKADETKTAFIYTQTNKQTNKLNFQKLTSKLGEVQEIYLKYT